MSTDLRNQLDQQSKTRNQAYSKMQKADSRFKNLNRKYSEKITFLQDKERRLNSRIANAYKEAYPNQQKQNRKADCKQSTKKQKPTTTVEQRQAMKNELEVVIGKLKSITSKVKTAENELQIASKRFEVEDGKLQKLSKRYQDSKKNGEIVDQMVYVYANLTK